MPAALPSRESLEALLRERKLDITLTSAAPLAGGRDRLAPIGNPDLDAALGGGLARGELSEVVGVPSSGRTTFVVRAVAAALGRGEVAALVDACDTFDPASAEAHGVDLARLLWVRHAPPIDVGRAVKAFSLVLQAGNFGLVVLDLADVPASALRRLPWTTWMRVARTIEGTDTVALLVGRERMARSARGVTMAIEARAPRWIGTAAPRARLFAGVAATPRVVRAR